MEGGGLRKLGDRLRKKPLGGRGNARSAAAAVKGGGDSLRTGGEKSSLFRKNFVVGDNKR